ncbi:BsuPI-related putative proteinase inhibitor [Gammaproteobacteria bacterium AB-CW1]|uniref:Intracellular proteinase inhibitor BsuPI domain-containing protein n=1 Tax=Natronospira elongata TaxID=3110268 RepID=A0AAP6MN70_9GAMM|nr:BsuPI-related putative proteinase inhibitor [Gammaproteobacteria bacterium AB-CW1]
MKFKHIFIASSLLFSINAQANDYFPIEAGDEFHYDKVTFGAETQGIKQMSVQNSSGEHWKLVSDFIGLGQKWVWTSEGNDILYVFNADSGYGESVVDFSAPEGASFATPLGPCNHTATIAARGESLQTAAGNFDDVIRVDFSGDCYENAIDSAWFAKGTGLVKWKARGIFMGGSIPSYELAHGVIDGNSFPARAELAYSMNLPSQRVMINQDGVIEAYLSVTNLGQAPVELRFDSKQHFEIELIDANGVVHSAWSTGKFFAQIVNYKTIETNETLTFGGELALESQVAEHLDIGTYTLRLTFKGQTTPNASIYSDAPVVIEAPVHLDSEMNHF